MDALKQTLEYYSKNAVEFSESTLSVDMSPLYQRFLPLLSANAYILDAGCGSGRDAFFFKQNGFQISAFDASPELARIASEHLQSPVAVSTFLDLNVQEQFDGIWCCASLLHVPRNELPRVLQKLHQALRINGVMYMSFKYGEEERIQNGRFFSDQTQDTLFPLLMGFEVCESWVTADQRPDRQHEKWLNVIVRKSELAINEIRN